MYILRMPSEDPKYISIEGIQIEPISGIVYDQLVAPVLGSPSLKLFDGVCRAGTGRILQDLNWDSCSSSLVRS